MESEAELEMLASEASRAGGAAPAAIRVNPDVEAGGHPHISTGHHTHKFGVDWEDALPLYLQYRDSRWIEWQGISAHIGSQILTLAPFRRALARLARYFRELADAGITLRYLDFGGGLGVRYSDEKPFSAADYAKTVTGIVRPLRLSSAARAGPFDHRPRRRTADARALYQRESRQDVCDRGRGDERFHPPGALRRRASDYRRRSASNGAASGEDPRRYRRTGLRIRRLFCCRIGRLAQAARAICWCLWGAGAYGFVEASNYNSRPRPPEILVDGADFRVIRRRESRTDLVRGE